MLCVLFFVYFIYFCASERDIRYHKYSLRFAVSVRVSLFTQFVSYHGKSISCIKQEKKSCAKFGIQSFWGWRRLRENSAFLTPLINKDNFVTFFLFVLTVWEMPTRQIILKLSSPLILKEKKKFEIHSLLLSSCFVLRLIAHWRVWIEKYKTIFCVWKKRIFNAICSENLWCKICTIYL